MKLTHMQLVGIMGMTWFISALITINLNMMTIFEARGVAVLATFFILLFAGSTINTMFMKSEQSE